jgi:mono/diheme cytochrome c family protein
MWNHLPQMASRMAELGIARPTLDVAEARDLMAFLYTLSYFDAPGNPEAGRRMFSEKRCVLCHQAGGVGGVVGPNLDALQQFGSPLYVAAAMWNHTPGMMAMMRQRQIERPSFTGAELRDLIAYLTPRAGGPGEGPVYLLPGRAQEGKRLFAQKRCSSCHGAKAEGGPVGPNLVDRFVGRTSIDFAAALWNKAPVMVAAQQARGIPVPQISVEEMADLVAYLYALRYFGEPGDVRRGAEVAARKGCLACHAVRGEKGKPASDLGRATGLDSTPAVIAALWNHAIVTGPAPGGKPAAWPEIRPGEMADLAAFLQSVGRR